MFRQRDRGRKIPPLAEKKGMFRALALLFPLALMAGPGCSPQPSGRTSSLLVHPSVEPSLFLPQAAGLCDNALELLLRIEERDLLSTTLPLGEGVSRGAVTFPSLPPAKGYHLIALFGFASPSQSGTRCEKVQVARASAEARFDLAPLERKELSLVLSPCTDRVFDRPCNTFRTEEIPAPVVLLYPARTGCSSYAIAVSKSAETTLRMRDERGEQDLAGSNTPAVYIRKTFSSEGPQQYFFQNVRSGVPSSAVTVTMEYRSGSLCFDPYARNSPHRNAPHFDSNTFTIHWDPGSASGDLKLVIASDPSRLRETLNDADMNSLNPITVPISTGSSGYNLTSLPSPLWHLGLYVKEEGFWHREGGLSYFPQWFSERREIQP